MILAVEDTLLVGEETFLESISPTTSFGVTFEDDGETGYFYAVNTQPEFQILDALHIYNAAAVTDGATPSKVQLFWTNDGQIASLLINGYCHAIFDFEAAAGYCRNAFPESSGKWTKVKDRLLTDELLEALFENRK